MGQENYNAPSNMNNDITLPACLAVYHPELSVYAYGDSMADEGIDDGDPSPTSRAGGGWCRATTVTTPSC